MALSLTKRFLNFKENLFIEITDVPDVLKQPHFAGLDGLRGISILVVLACHLAVHTPYIDYFSGDIGVETFFVISGFLITSLLLKEKVKRRKVSFRNFYIRRFLRIVPVAYLFLLALMLLNNYLKLNTSGFDFLTAFLYIKNVPFHKYPDWYTGHFWTLSVEEQFYICFPFFMVTRTNKFILFAAALIFLLPFMRILGFSNIGIFYSNRMLHLALFGVITMLGNGTASILVGSLYAILLFKKVITIEKIKGNYFLAFLLFVIACLVLTKKSPLYVQYWSEFLFPFFIGYVLLLNLKGKNLFAEILDNRLMVKIGILSYSIYIWQQLFLSEQAFHLFPFSDNVIVRLLLVFVVSWLSYTYFEKFFLKYIKHFEKA